MGGDVIGCILAGGLARRMGGGDKGLIRLGGRPILDHVVARLQPQVESLVLNANGDPARFAGAGLPVVADTIEGFAGPLAGVLAGLDWARTRAPQARYVVTAATDTPFLPRDLVARLLAAVDSEGADLATVASNGRRHPVFGLWPVRLAEDLERAMRDEGLRKVDIFTGRYRLAVAQFADAPYDPFFNANAPADVAEAERIEREFGA
jgi:molybdopterin-guanine dinucleotide biosynthesis protein A